MKKRLRKSITFVLMIAFIFTTVFPAYANDTFMTSGMASEILTKAPTDMTYSQKEKVSSDAEVLSTYGLLKLGEVEKVNVNNEKIEYVIDYGQVKETVEIVSNSSEELVLNVTADNVKDTLVINHITGEVSVDGNKVEAEKTVTPRVSDRYITETCPYGSASEYNKALGVIEQNNNIYLNDFIKNLTLTGFTIVLGIIGGVSGSIAVGIAAFLYSEMTKTYPNTDTMSYKTYGYYHKNSGSSGYISDYGAAVTKLMTYFYAAANCQDYVCRETNYEVWIKY